MSLSQEGTTAASAVIVHPPGWCCVHGPSAQMAPEAPEVDGELIAQWIESLDPGEVEKASLARMGSLAGGDADTTGQAFLVTLAELARG